MEHFINEVYEQIWKDRYQKNNETYDENLKRVAKFVAKAEGSEASKEFWENKFYEVMRKGYFFPAGRTMSNSNIGRRLTLNNCFVAPIVPNSMEGIFNSVKLGAVTHKAGGGIGYNFSNLSPRGTKTHNDAIASGPISFMDVFNAQTATVQQGSRRGANMSILSIYHPDIMEFIEAKSSDANRLNHFNVSVLVDDNFMRAVENDEMITLHYPIYDECGNKLSSDKWTKEFNKEVKATEIWDSIMKMAYDNGEPGIFFEDTMQKHNPANYVENIICTNPCSEYLAGTIKKENEDPNEYGGACNLGSIFLHNFVEKPFTKEAYLNYNKLSDTIAIAVRMLDDIIDVNKFPDPIYENYQKNMRTIGLGYTGLADMLAMLGLKYNTREARDYVNDLFSTLTNLAYKCSIDLAKEKGAFNFCDPEKHANTLFAKEEIPLLKDNIAKHGIRNAKIFAVAPCGTISMTYGNNCSSGIEPIFSLSYDRKVKIGGQEEDNAKIVKMMDYAYYLYNSMVEKGERVDFAPEDIFVTALEIDVEDHIKMLATIAKHIDMSVSKTINVPTDYPYEKTKDIYMNCWKLGVKGCTIFRPNAIRQGILFTEDNKPKEETTELVRGEWKRIAPDTIYFKRKIKIGCGKLALFIGWSEKEQAIQELYVKRTGAGGCEMNIQACVITMSGMLRLGGNIFNIEKAFEGLGACNSFVLQRAKGKQLSQGSSCATAILNEIKAFLKEQSVEVAPSQKVDTKPTIVTPTTITSSLKCPECGAPMTMEGGCVICKSCGYSKCN